MPDTSSDGVKRFYRFKKIYMNQTINEIGLTSTIKNIYIIFKTINKNIIVSVIENYIWCNLSSLKHKLS